MKKTTTTKPGFYLVHWTGDILHSLDANKKAVIAEAAGVIQKFTWAGAKCFSSYKKAVKFRKENGLVTFTIMELRAKQLGKV